MKEASQLAALQQQVLQALRVKQAPPADWIAGNEASTQRRLHVYRYAYRARLAQVLADNFPKLASLLGDEWWQRLADAYLDAHPPSHYSIRWFGEHLPAWLETAALFERGAALADLARLEWTLGVAFEARDETPVTGAALACVSLDEWPGIRLRLCDGVARLSLRHRIGPTFHALKAGVDDVPAPEPGENDWLVWRMDRRPHFRSVDPEESALLDLASQGEPFSAWCERAAEGFGEDDAPVRVIGYFQRWLADGIIASFDVSTGT